MSILEEAMTGRFYIVSGAAALVGSLIIISPAAAQPSGAWVDPPSDLGSARTEPAKPAAPAPSTTQPVPKAPESTGSVSAAPQPAPQPTAAAPTLPAKATARVGRVVRSASPSVRATEARPKVRQARSVQPRPARTAQRETTRGAMAPRERVSVAGRTLEIMNLQTIELPDGRRYQVLTRPDPDTVEALLSGP